MDIKTITTLLNKKNTTYNDILDKLKEFVTDFQQQRENYYTEEYKQATQLTAARPPTADQMNELAEKITNSINDDTKMFIRKYASDTADEVLDALNSKKIRRKKAAYAFLSVLVALRSAFDESYVNEDV